MLALLATPKLVTLFVTAWAVTIPTVRACGEQNSTTPFVMPQTITLDRVRRCRNKWTCNSELVREDYRVLDDALSVQRARKLYISQVNTPPKSATRNVAFFIAGQGFKKGLQSGVTGQNTKFEFADSTTGTQSYTLTSTSLPKRIFETNLFSSTDTFVGLVFDARFNFEYSATTKARILDAYYQYLVGKIGDDDNVGTIYLAGHSRGGCLSMRLSQLLTATYPRARVIVHTFDPVCAHPSAVIQQEFGVGLPLVVNPVKMDPNWWVYSSNLLVQFSTSSRTCLDVRSVISGDPVISIAKTGLVHGFGHFSFFGQTNTISHNGRPWYNQTFVDDIHEIVEASWNWDIEHFRHAMTTMPCPCGTAAPPAPTRAPITRPPIPKTYGRNEPLPGSPVAPSPSFPSSPVAPPTSAGPPDPVRRGI